MRLADGVFGSDVRLSYTEIPGGPNLKDLFGSNLSPDAAFSAHISVVVRARSKKQMVRIDAPPVVALMQDALLFRDWTAQDLP